MFTLAFTTLSCLSVASGQTDAGQKSDPVQSLSFLVGTWDANVQNNAMVKLTGRYTFAVELAGHVLARHSTTDPYCKAPENFDCAHRDLFYVFQDLPGSPLKAIYFDSEGHTIRYSVVSSTPASVVFLSEPGPGPQFRLTYALNSGVMIGRFEMQMPKSTDWHAYLEWSGSKTGGVRASPEPVKK